MNSFDPEEFDLLELIQTYIDEGRQLIQFSFEKEELIELDDSYFKYNNGISVENAESFKEDIINHIKDSNMLVIIGYSFPIFNREIDCEILNYFKMNVDDKKKIIYYQDITDRTNKIKTQFNLEDESFDIRFYDDTSQLLIPDEY